jgi:hypothetical protein
MNRFTERPAPTADTGAETADRQWRLHHQRVEFVTPASFPHLHCPQAQVCAAAKVRRGRRLACFSTPSRRRNGWTI